VALRAMQLGMRRVRVKDSRRFLCAGHRARLSLRRHRPKHLRGRRRALQGPPPGRRAVRRQDLDSRRGPDAPRQCVPEHPARRVHSLRLLGDVGRESRGRGRSPRRNTTAGGRLQEHAQPRGPLEQSLRRRGPRAAGASPCDVARPGARQRPEAAERPRPVRRAAPALLVPGARAGRASSKR
jgi:hypothetical protein